MARAVSRGLTSFLANASGGASSSANKVIRSFGTGLALLSLDSEYQRRRARTLYGRQSKVWVPICHITGSSLLNALPKHVSVGHTACTSVIQSARQVQGVWSGVAQGSLQLGRGVIEGISGVVVKPVQGARRGGAVGLVKGTVTGILGVAIKPAVRTFLRVVPSAHNSLFTDVYHE